MERLYSVEQMEPVSLLTKWAKGKKIVEKVTDENESKYRVTQEVLKPLGDFFKFTVDPPRSSYSQKQAKSSVLPVINLKQFEAVVDILLKNFDEPELVFIRTEFSKDNRLLTDISVNPIRAKIHEPITAQGVGFEPEKCLDLLSYFVEPHLDQRILDATSAADVLNIFRQNYPDERSPLEGLGSSKVHHWELAVAFFTLDYYSDNEKWSYIQKEDALAAMNKALKAPSGINGENQVEREQLTVKVKQLKKEINAGKSREERFIFLRSKVINEWSLELDTNLIEYLHETEAIESFAISLNTLIKLRLYAESLKTRLKKHLLPEIEEFLKRRATMENAKAALKKALQFQSYSEVLLNSISNLLAEELPALPGALQTELWPPCLDLYEPISRTLMKIGLKFSSLAKLLVNTLSLYINYLSDERLADDFKNFNSFEETLVPLQGTAFEDDMDFSRSPNRPTGLLYPLNKMVLEPFRASMITTPLQVFVFRSVPHEYETKEGKDSIHAGFDSDPSLDVGRSIVRGIRFVAEALEESQTIPLIKFESADSVEALQRSAMAIRRTFIESMRDLLFGISSKIKRSIEARRDPLVTLVEFKGFQHIQGEALLIEKFVISSLSGELFLEIVSLPYRVGTRTLEEARQCVQRFEKVYQKGRVAMTVETLIEFGSLISSTDWVPAIKAELQALPTVRILLDILNVYPDPQRLYQALHREISFVGIETSELTEEHFNTPLILPKFIHFLEDKRLAALQLNMVQILEEVEETWTGLGHLGESSWIWAKGSVESEEDVKSQIDFSEATKKYESQIKNQLHAVQLFPTRDPQEGGVEQEEGRRSFGPESVDRVRKQAVDELKFINDNHIKKHKGKQSHALKYEEAEEQFLSQINNKISELRKISFPLFLQTAGGSSLVFLEKAKKKLRSLSSFLELSKDLEFALHILEEEDRSRDPEGVKTQGKPTIGSPQYKNEYEALASLGGSAELLLHSRKLERHLNWYCMSAHLRFLQLSEILLLILWSFVKLSLLKGNHDNSRQILERISSELVQKETDMQIRALSNLGQMVTQAPFSSYPFFHNLESTLREHFKKFVSGKSPAESLRKMEESDNSGKVKHLISFKEDRLTSIKQWKQAVTEVIQQSSRPDQTVVNINKDWAEELRAKVQRFEELKNEEFLNILEQGVKKINPERYSALNILFSHSLHRFHWFLKIGRKFEIAIFLRRALMAFPDNDGDPPIDMEELRLLVDKLQSVASRLSTFKENTLVLTPDQSLKIQQWKAEVERENTLSEQERQALFKKIKKSLIIQSLGKSFLASIAKEARTSVVAQNQKNLEGVIDMGTRIILGEVELAETENFLEDPPIKAVEGPFLKAHLLCGGVEEEFDSPTKALLLNKMDFGASRPFPWVFLVKLFPTLHEHHHQFINTFATTAEKSQEDLKRESSIVEEIQKIIGKFAGGEPHEIARYFCQMMRYAHSRDQKLNTIDRDQGEF